MEHISIPRRLFLDAPTARNSLSVLLNIDVKEVTSEFSATGHSGSTYKITTLDGDERKHEFILKRVPDDSYSTFYQEVLSRYDFDSPKVYGIVSIDENLFLVTDFIPHEPAEWGNKLKYKRAIEWLIKKDSIARNSLNDLASCS